MASTNFKQWNPGIANIQTDEEYTADTQRAGGAVSGVFPSTTANKLFFQLASMVTALATMMVNKGYTVEDGSAGTSGHNFTALVAVLANLMTAIDQQKCTFVYAAGGGTANAHTATYTPAVPALTDGLLLGFKAANANTGASTFSPNGLTAKPIYGLGHLALQGGEIVANGDVWVMYNSSLNSGNGAWVLLSTSGGCLQVANPAQSYHALNRLTGDARYQPLDSDLTAIAAIVGQRGDIIYYGPSGWTRLGKGTQGYFLAQGANDPAWSLLNFAAYLASSGYQCLPNGLIFQWGSLQDGGAKHGTTSFPISFPSACLFCVVINTNNNVTTPTADPRIATLYNTPTKSSFKWECTNANTNVLEGPGWFSWFAIGY